MFLGCVKREYERRRVESVEKSLFIGVDLYVIKIKNVKVWGLLWKKMLNGSYCWKIGVFCSCNVCLQIFVYIFGKGNVNDGVFVVFLCYELDV